MTHFVQPGAGEERRPFVKEISFFYVLRDLMHGPEIVCSEFLLE